MCVSERECECECEHGLVFSGRCWPLALLPFLLAMLKAVLAYAARFVPALGTPSHLRFPLESAARSGPAPTIKHGPAHKIAANLYFQRCVAEAMPMAAMAGKRWRAGSRSLCLSSEGGDFSVRFLRFHVCGISSSDSTNPFLSFPRSFHCETLFFVLSLCFTCSLGLPLCSLGVLPSVALLLCRFLRSALISLSAC